MSNVVEVSGLHKRFSDGDATLEVLSGVDFRLESAASLAITGPSGSGKSTLLNVLAGLLKCDAGSVVLRAQDSQIDMAAASEADRTRFRRRHIGYVHQFYNLVPTLTVLENVRLPGRLNRGSALDGYARALLGEFGLEARANAFPDVLSGGEQQRVAVARALVLTPALILADEPTGNLDGGNSEAVADSLFSAAAERGVALVVATHSEAVAARADLHLRLDVGGAASIATTASQPP